LYDAHVTGTDDVGIAVACLRDYVIIELLTV